MSDVKNGKLSLNLGKETMEFELRKSMGLPHTMDDFQIADPLENVFSDEPMIVEKDDKSIEELFDTSEQEMKNLPFDNISAVGEEEKASSF